MTALDIENIELLDFDPELGCETQKEDCPRTPEWLSISTCCGHESLLCTPHKELWEKDGELLVEWGGYICPYCHKLCIEDETRSIRL